MTAREKAEAFLDWVRRQAPGEAEQAPPELPAPGPFIPPGDRWEGWWRDDLAPWPEDADLGPERVAAALRRLPPDLQEVLVMGEAMGSATPGDDDGAQAAEVLDQARQAFVAYLEEQVSGSPARPAGAG